MSYKDPERQREYHRGYKRLRRTGICQTHCQPCQTRQTQLAEDFRLRTAQDVLTLIADEVQIVRSDPAAGTLEKARVVGFLAGIALRAVEAADLAARVEALEQTLSKRKETPCVTDWPEPTPSLPRENACTS